MSPEIGNHPADTLGRQAPITTQEVHCDINVAPLTEQLHGAPGPQIGGGEPERRSYDAATMPYVKCYTSELGPVWWENATVQAAE